MNADRIDDSRAREGRIARAVARLEEQPSRLLCVVGPTASGKTDLALAVCEQVGGEVVSADSVQIYRDFDIGSGKPTAEERARATHHVVDALDPLDPIDAAAYARLAERAIEDVRARGKIPVLCGGTFFWVRALVLGLAEAPPGDPAIRARHRAFVEEQGRAALHDELARRDPITGAKLHPNDVVRVSRALEVLELSGKRMSEWQAEHGFRAQRLDAKLIGIGTEASVLTERIAARVDRWLASGWIDEVDALLQRGYGEARAMSSVGYAEIRAMLQDALPRDALKDAIVRATRVFARRQRTWLNHADVEWV